MFRRCVLLFEAGRDPGPALQLLKQFAPGVEQLHVLTHIPTASPFWLGATPPPSLAENLERGEAIVQALRAALDGWIPHVRAELVLELDEATIGRAVEELEADLILFGPVDRAAARPMTGRLDDVSAACGVPILWMRVDSPSNGPGARGKVSSNGADAPGHAPANGTGAQEDSPSDGDGAPGHVHEDRDDVQGESGAPAITHILCPFDADLRTVGASITYLRSHATQAQRATFLSFRRAAPPAARDLAGLAELAGLPCPVQSAQLDAGLFEIEAAFTRFILEHGVELVVVPLDGVRGLTAVAVGLFARRWLEQTPVPVLLLPARRDLSEPLRQHARLEAPDVMVTGCGPLHLYVEQVNRLGQSTEAQATHIFVVARGRLVGTAALDRGLATLELPEASSDPPTAFGVGRLEGEPPVDPVAALEATVQVILPGDRRVTLFDAGLEPAAAFRLRELFPDSASSPAGRLLMAVRLRATEGFRQLRSHLRRAGLEDAGVIDAGVVLQDGRPADLPSGIDDIRLGRVAARLRADGVQVDSVVCSSPRVRQGSGYRCFGAEELVRIDAGELEASIALAWRPPSRRRGDGCALGDRLDELTASRTLAGNEVHIELNNGRALERLIAFCDAARDRIHLQAYIVRDDPTTVRIEDALVRAAGRGVTVRILADSLYSLHGSFGTRNPLLERLAACPGIELHTIRPIEQLPSLEDLKQRNHRKLVIVDGETGIVTGRNLAAEYYRGFDEVQLTSESFFAELPWLDAGAELAGPAVRAVDGAFLESWIAAGGAPFPLLEPPPVGTSDVRVVLHRGLADTYTLDAYLALIQAARSHLYVVNTFPLQLEIQHALLEAIRRGVRLRLLCGNVRPTYGERTPFRGAGAHRELATQVVLSRIGPLVEAGGEAYEFSLEGLPGWDSSLARVRPHVHAKILSCDGENCAIGSANLDITAGYWESEALLVVEDPEVTRALELELDELLSHSLRIDPEDMAWRQLAQRRAWLSRHWPSVLS